MFTDRGFTGHEHLNAFNLIDMNGRVYDPILGRFLSPDPYVQMPGFTQCLNRYSYCLNNPLIFTDPSGEAWTMWPIVWGGNWLIGGLDRWLNGKQSFKQAFSVKNNPVVIGGNYSPSDIKFSNYQVDAQRIANLPDKIGTNAYNKARYEWQAASERINNWASRVDWPGVTNASLGVLGGVGEMVVGGTGEYFSAGTASPLCVPLMVDGGYRTATNFSRLVGYLTLNNRFANAMPGNIGATIGKGIDMLSGVSIDGYGYGQGFGGATNDFVSFIVTGGTAGSISNMVNNPTLGNGIWYMSAYGGYTNSLFYDLYPFKK